MDPLLLTLFHTFMASLFVSEISAFEPSCVTLPFPQVSYHPLALSVARHLQGAIPGTMLFSADISLLAHLEIAITCVK